MKTMWIKQAIQAGGTMGLYGPGHGVIRATMGWPGESSVYGEASATIEGAIESLNEALMHDAAKEMQENGSV